MSVTVASPAKVILVVAGEKQEQDQEVKVVWGQEVNIECQVVQLGNPAPAVHLKLNNSTHDQASMTYFPTLKESGSRWLLDLFISWHQSTRFKYQLQVFVFLDSKGT